MQISIIKMSASINPDDIALHFNFVSESVLQLVTLRKVTPNSPISLMVPIWIQNFHKVNGSWVKISEYEPPHQFGNSTNWINELINQ